MNPISPDYQNRIPSFSLNSRLSLLGKLEVNEYNHPVTYPSLQLPPSFLQNTLSRLKEYDLEQNSKEKDLKEQDSKERQYLPFKKRLIVKLASSLVGNHSPVHKLYTLLIEKYKNLLNFEINKDTIVFHHSFRELNAFVLAKEPNSSVLVHKDLFPFFYHESFIGKGCFNDYISSENLCNSEYLKSSSNKNLIENYRKFFECYQEKHEYIINKEFSMEKIIESYLNKKEGISDKEVLIEKIAKNIFEEVLTMHEGICIGEKNEDPFAKKILIELMEKLEELQVGTLFLEHLMYDTMQPYLDKYLESSLDTPMPKILETYLDYLSKSFHLTSPYTYKDLIIKAKKHKIRIVGISTSAASGIRLTPFQQYSNERLTAINYVATKIIRHEKNIGKKFIALMESSHGSRVHFGSKEIGPAGISQLQNCPFILIENEEDQNIQLDVNFIVRSNEFKEKILLEHADICIAHKFSEHNNESDDDLGESEEEIGEREESESYLQPFLVD